MIVIDNITYDFKSNSGTLYQFCYSKNIVLPCFCYHEKLSIAGNCRMCLVEVNGALVVSCAFPLLDNMQIITKSYRLLHARENVLEFLLINHPLDCPICDQGGECDLQDISMTFGLDRGRFYEIKRSVDNLNCCGPLIKTVMTRCIHCTRCVRFLNEYCDIFDLGILARGASMEIGTYIERFTLDALSANIIDLCPVGALTSMPYAFTARPWELKTIESIDIFDSLASSIRVDVVNNRITRIAPVLMEAINEDWLTNKARFAYDSLSMQRIYYPKLFINNNLIIVSWLKALYLFIFALDNFKWKNIFSFCGYFLDLETTWSLKIFLNSFGCSNIFYQESLYPSNFDFRFLYLLNVTTDMLENICSYVILLNNNLRLENPLLNSRLRKNYLKNFKENKKVFTIISFGQAMNYATYPIYNLGNSIYSFLLFIQGKYYYFNNLFFNYKNFYNLSFFNIFKPYHLYPILLVGGYSLAYRNDFAQILQSSLYFCQLLKKHFFLNKKIFNFVCGYLGQLSFFETATGMSNNLKKNIKNAAFSYFIGVEKISNLSFFSKSNFIVFQGSHMPKNYKGISLFFPTATYVEHAATYINIEGRLRLTKVSLATPRLILSDMEVIRLLNLIKKKCIIHNFSILTNFYSTTSFLKLFLNINYKCCFFGTLEKFLRSFECFSGFKLRAFYNYAPYLINKYFIYLLNIVIYPYKISTNLFNKGIYNYYASDYLSKNSKIMAICSTRLLLSNFSEK